MPLSGGGLGGRQKRDHTFCCSFSTPQSTNEHMNGVLVVISLGRCFVVTAVEALKFVRAHAQRESLIVFPY